MTVIDYRPGSSADIDALVATTLAGYTTYVAFAPAGWAPPDQREWLLEQFQRPRVWCEIASIDGEPCGHSLVVPASESRLRDPDPTVGHVRHLFVRPEQHGSGAAAALNARLLDEGRTRGFARMRLFTPAPHARARRFYEREGWSLASAPEFVPELGIAMVEYRQDL